MCRVTYKILEPSVQRPLFRGVRHERVGEVERCRRRYPLRVDKAKKETRKQRVNRQDQPHSSEPRPPRVHAAPQ